MQINSSRLTFAWLIELLDSRAEKKEETKEDEAVSSKRTNAPLNQKYYAGKHVAYTHINIYLGT